MPLEELSRWLCNQAEAYGDRHQGLLVDKAILSADEWLDHDGPELVGAVYEFVEWADEQEFLPGEFSVPCFISQTVERYLASVHNGGHNSYLHNEQWRTPQIRCIEFGLQAMDCLDFLRVFPELRQFIESDFVRAARIADSYNNHDREFNELLRDFDRRIFELDLKAQIAKQSRWLRNNLKFEWLNSKEVETKRRQLSSLNKRYRERTARYGDRTAQFDASAKIQKDVRAVVERLDPQLSSERLVAHNGWGRTLDRTVFGEDPHFSRNWTLGFGSTFDTSVFRSLVVASCSKDGVPKAYMYAPGSAFFPYAVCELSVAEYRNAALPGVDRSGSG